MQSQNEKTEFRGGLPTAAALGFFDGVHRGHASVLGAAADYAREHGCRPLAVTFGARPGGGPLLMTKAQRERALRAMSFDVRILDFGAVRNLSPDAFVSEVLVGRFHAAAVFCGFNYRFGKDAAAGTAELAALCARESVALRVLPSVEMLGAPVSSTRIRALIAEGKIEEANRLLGRRFAVEGEVIHGRMLGRQLGYPTVNQKLPPELVRPRFGVYASFVRLGGAERPAVTNIGVRPTVDKRGEDVLCETYIPGFSGDLYARSLTVSLAAFLRPEKCFPGVAELGEQMGRDAREALRLLSV